MREEYSAEAFFDRVQNKKIALSVWGKGKYYFIPYYLNKKYIKGDIYEKDKDAFVLYDKDREFSLGDSEILCTDKEQCTSNFDWYFFDDCPSEMGKPKQDCTCDINNLFNMGCQCGAFKQEQDGETKQSKTGTAKTFSDMHKGMLKVGDEVRITNDTDKLSKNGLSVDYAATRATITQVFGKAYELKTFDNDYRYIAKEYVERI